MASPRFDEYLDVLQRVIELQGFVLDRFSLPWKAAKHEDDQKQTALVRSQGKPLLDLEVTARKSESTRNDQPGLLVFRDAFPPNTNMGEQPSLVLAFVIPESPVSGVNKAAFQRALELIEKYFHQQLTDECAQDDGTKRKVLHLLTPCFNGSQASLETVLRDWAGQPSRAKRKYHFRVISGNASQLEETRLNALFANDPAPSHRLTFRSMVHKTTTVRCDAGLPEAFARLRRRECGDLDRVEYGIGTGDFSARARSPVEASEVKSRAHRKSERTSPKEAPRSSYFRCR